MKHPHRKAYDAWCGTVAPSASELLQPEEIPYVARSYVCCYRRAIRMKSYRATTGNVLKWIGELKEQCRKHNLAIPPCLIRLEAELILSPR